MRARLYVVIFFSWPWILPMVPPALATRLRTFRRREPEPQAKSRTLSRRFLGPVFGSWLSRVTMAERTSEICWGGVEFASFLSGARGKLANQVFIGIAQRIDICGELSQPFGDLLDDRAELGIAIGIGAPEFIGRKIDFGKQAVEGALEGFVFDVLEAGLEGVEQFAVLGASHVGDAGPEVVWLDDVMDLAAHLFLEIDDVARVVGIPEREGHAAVIGLNFGVILAEFLLCGGLVVVREVPQEKEGEHVIAEVIRVHGAAELIGDVPERLA